jgi:hypothetical protein
MAAPIRAGSVRVIFISHRHRQSTRRIYRYIKGNWPTAHLAIFNVLVACILVVDQHDNGFSTVGTTHNLLCQGFHKYFAGLFCMKYVTANATRPYLLSDAIIGLFRSFSQLLFE